jgi:hypothetical protein
MECLENIIGISQTTCPCLTEGLSSDEVSSLNTSNSGVWLDQLDNFNPAVVGSADDCNRGSFWERAERARRNAILDYKTQFLSAISGMYKPRIDTLNVQLGDSAFSGTLNLNTTYAGIKIMPVQIKGAYIIIKKLGIVVNNGAAVVVKIFSNINNGTLVYESTPINATPNTLTWGVPAEPIELPMWSYQGYIRYWVVMELDGTFQPKATKKDCGCGGVQRPYLQWLDFAGAKGSDETNLEGFSATNETNGIVLDAQIKCRASELICSEEYPLDFTDEAGALGTAYAIRFRTAAILYNEVLSTTNINRESMMNRDEMQALVTSWQNEFSEWIKYQIDNLDLDQNNCYVCKTNLANSLHKNFIRVT